jgi:DNA-binding transcriptional LysR family regulator
MKNATLRQLTVFETVAQHLHFTRAAQALGTTQPSVSMQIKQLEDNLGVALFEQIGKRIYLTEAGRELERYCREISRQLAAAETVLDRLKGIRGGLLRLAIAPAAKYFVSRLLAEFVRRHPGVTVDLRIDDRAAMLEQLEANERDMVVMTSPPPDSALVAEPFLADPLVAIAAPGHALAGERALPPWRLAQEPFLMREPGSETRRTVEDFFARQGFALAVVMAVNSNEAIKQGVQAGLGVAIVPAQSVLLERELGRLAILDIASMPLQCSWELVHREGKRFSCVAESFRSFVLCEARRHVPGAGRDAGSAGD